MPEKLNVALLVHTTTAWEYQILEGVVRYAKRQEHWRVFHEHGRVTNESLFLPSEWMIDGILALLRDSQTALQVQERGVPVVNLSSIHLEASARLPRVCEDIAGIGLMAANHFADLGFKHFAYYGSSRNEFYTSLRDAFAKGTKAAAGDFSCHPLLEQGTAPRKKGNDTSGLKEWILSLPKPVGILAREAESAAELSEVCRELEILIPEQVAILIVGAVNDPTYDILEPPTSSVAVDASLIGYQAAVRLDELMRQKQESNHKPAPQEIQGGKPPGPILVPPMGIDLRRSTKTLAIENEHVAKALFYIRNHALEPITVADVLKHVSVSRPRIEILFRQYLNRSPAEEIRRLRLARAEELLRETNLSIPEVAGAAGFKSPEYLARVFKAAKGITPLRYRRS